MQVMNYLYTGLLLLGVVISFLSLIFSFSTKRPHLFVEQPFSRYLSVDTALNLSFENVSQVLLKLTFESAPTKHGKVEIVGNNKIPFYYLSPGKSKKLTFKIYDTHANSEIKKEAVNLCCSYEWVGTPKWASLIFSRKFKVDLEFDVNEHRWGKKMKIIAAD